MIKKPGFLRHISIILSLLLLGWPSAVEAAGKPYVKSSTRTSKRRSRALRYRYGVPTFADSTGEDMADYDDPVVRDVAVKALGRYNGSVVAMDPGSGRILTVVNQKLAFSDGFIPCSTIKPTIAVAALEENVITRDTLIPVARRRYMNLTEAMAHSNNRFFEELGRRMGFETVSKYARLMGLGELAGYSIPEEHPGAFPSEAPKNGGVARMSSFGEGIQITPLQLASLASAIANGGTMYYLQYPRSDQERQNFTPRIKRKLDIEPLLPELREGMLAAVLYGTARRGFDHDPEEQYLGKTGTCSDQHSRLGWFVSFSNQVSPKLALVVLIRGNTHRVMGPTAAEIAGHIYHGLRERNYFAQVGAGSSASSAATLLPAVNSRP